ncbi:transporter substrate-binding domain-containing protein [Marinomonas pollencensis]|uniref:histidine kinase n=1 Tax=Marinomonas pollencensis TaxID=491954 RepID=A0A3E0DU83_9GAMM|nr:transporter substrate-binding domain-containing protein [Marinomonas pollencensis]REG85048.1 amino acid-binding domain sensor histidine kinase [Marinomonas pollencensis]
MFRYCLCVCSLFFLSAFDASARGQTDSTNNLVIIGGDFNYPPYEFIDKEGNPAGYGTELTKEIAAVMGINIEIRLGKWSDMREAIENGEIDVLQGIAYSAERAKLYDFSPHYAIVNQSVFARDDQPTSINSIEDLQGKEVIVQKHGIMHDLILEQDIKINLFTVDTHADALRLLASGQHDYAVVANLPGLYVGQEFALSNIKPVGQTFAAQRYGFGVKKGNEDLLAKFSEGLAILKNTGRQQEIYDKWFAALERSQYPWKKVGQTTAIVSLLLLISLGGIGVWNRMLKKEVNRRAEELKQQQKQLLQADKMASLGVLVSGVAHEINNPCSLVSMNISILKGVLRDSEGVYEAHYQQHGDFNLGGIPYSRMREKIPYMLEDIATGAQRIRRIVDDLRDFARQGPLDLSEQVDLNLVAEVSIRLVDNTIKQSTFAFSTELNKALPTFLGNKQKIEQVVINLIVNACQALNNPQQGIKVFSYVNEVRGMVCLEVQDQGRGIEAGDLSKLNDPFFTTKRDQGGMGLGLSVSSGIVQEHGGTLEYESVLGLGTRAILSLPIHVRGEAI